ncbi:transglycosylase family protein [Streptomyces sp. NPDC023327]|uniref:transglycosylase family protein n=1 Tax=Streptomyces sp. NPDC023327 TaxID=3157088 RepID=UPI0034082DA2
MLSGNGRHRRPRQAPALIVAAGVTGSAIAIPLLGATSASAAETVTWDKLAECESGGEWSADPGNGYYGGLQLSQEAWEQHGGLNYAPSADEASKSQQIAVAEDILDAKGPKAWPSCGPIAGLTDGGAAADVDPGDPILPESSDTSGAGGTGGKGSDEKARDKAREKTGEKAGEGESAAGKAAGSADASDGTSDKRKPSGRAGDTPGADRASRDKNHDGTDAADTSDDKGGASEADKSGAEEGTSRGPKNPSDTADPADASEGSATGRHRAGDADETSAADARNGDGGPTGRHASRGGERTQKVADGTYEVRSGDNLSVIADDLDVKGGWHELYSENKETVGADPDLILPGQSLDLGEK